ncbi:MAG: PilZ domain-containing protein [Pseudomonadota bacterium]
MQYRSHRYQTQYPVNLHTPSGVQRGSIIDVNNGGARVLGMHDLARGDKVSMTVLSHKIDAIVCWAESDRAGLTFRPRLNDHMLDTVRYRRDPRAGMNGRARAFGFPEMR